MKRGSCVYPNPLINRGVLAKGQSADILSAYSHHFFFERHTKTYLIYLIKLENLNGIHKIWVWDHILRWLPQKVILEEILKMPVMCFRSAMRDPSYLQSCMTRSCWPWRTRRRKLVSKVLTTTHTHAVFQYPYYPYLLALVWVRRAFQIRSGEVWIDVHFSYSTASILAT